MISPSGDDPLIGALSEVAGGRIGRYRAAPSVIAWQRRALAVCSVFATLAIMAALAVRNHCRSTLWASPDQFTHLCYSDIPAVYSAGALSSVTPYLERADGGYLAQPVGTGGLLWLIGVITPGGTAELRWVFDVATVIVLLALLVTVVCVGLLAGRRAWDAALVAASPVVVTSALISLDLVAVALATAGLLAFARHRVWFAGVLLGLAVAVRPIEVAIVVAVLIVAARRDRLAPAGTFLIGTVLAWLAVNLPIALLAADGWAAYWRTLWQAQFSYGSLYLIPQVLSLDLGAGRTLASPPIWLAGLGLVVVLGYAGTLAALRPPDWRAWLPSRWWVTVVVAAAVIVVPAVLVALGSAGLSTAPRPLPAGAGRVVALIGLPLVTAFVVWVAHRAPLPPRIPVLALLLLIGWLLVLPAIPVQAGVWLLPLLALAVPSWRLMALVGTAEVAYGAITWLYLYGLEIDNRGAPAWVYLAALLFRVGVWLWVAWEAWALTWWPEDDVVRHDLGPDPVAGPLLADASNDVSDARSADISDAPRADVPDAGPTDVSDVLPDGAEAPPHTR